MVVSGVFLLHRLHSGADVRNFATLWPEEHYSHRLYASLNRQVLRRALKVSVSVVAVM